MGKRSGSILTARQTRFVAEYLVDLNGTQAAIRAGYSPRTAEAQASRLLRNVKVSAAVAKGQAARFRKVEITAERVLREAGGLAFSSLQDLVDDDGNLLPIKEWPQDAAAAVSSVELTKRNLVAGDGAQENVVKIRLWDKPANVQILMKHLGLLTDQVDHKHSGRFELVWAEDE